MGLKSLIERLQKRLADTPDTLEKNMRYQRKAPIHAGCTPDTPDTSCFVNTEAANDLALEPPADPNAWRELAAAYYAHHFNCSTCTAAGRGAGYGLRCGFGAALWNCYQNKETLSKEKS